MYYSTDHQWFRRVDGEIVIGISDYAQEELGDVVFVELPAPGTAVVSGEQLVTIESVKAVSEIALPLSGTVARINPDLADAPELINSDPTGDGWLLVVSDADDTVIDTLMDEAGYAAYVDGLG